MIVFDSLAQAAEATSQAAQAEPMWAAITAICVALIQAATHYLAHRAGVRKGKKSVNSDDS